MTPEQLERAFGGLADDDVPTPSRPELAAWWAKHMNHYPELVKK